MSTRTLQEIITGIPTSDGAGVKLVRSVGAGRRYVDPFLLMDEFSSDDAADYIAGFPSHPHRGFETVTYMLDGHMLHEDHLGNRGDLQSGDVQWMTAGRGIIHSEMPQQTEGRMRGFQLWINLPAAEKMQTAAYRDIPAAGIPSIPLPGGGQVKVIAGSASIGGSLHDGPINASGQKMSTDPLYLDVELPAGAEFSHPVETGHNAFLYVHEGAARVTEREVPSHCAGILSLEGEVTVKANENGARFLLLAGRPLNEPVVQYGPFVMNTLEEIKRAVADYHGGTFTAE